MIDIVRWSAGDPVEHSFTRTARPVFCTRDALDVPERAGVPHH